MRRLLALAAGAALAALLAQPGCGTQPRTVACPGDPVGTFRFHGQPVALDGGACGFAGDGGLDFTATLAFTAADAAVLCVDRPEAAPLAGSRAGDHLVLTAPATAATASSCTCAVQVTETVEGDVLRADGGATGFAGDLDDALEAVDAGAGVVLSCEPDAGTPCGVPCQLRWQLTAAP